MNVGRVDVSTSLKSLDPGGRSCDWSPDNRGEERRGRQGSDRERGHLPFRRLGVWYKETLIFVNNRDLSSFSFFPFIPPKETRLAVGLEGRRVQKVPLSPRIKP